MQQQCGEDCIKWRLLILSRSQTIFGRPGSRIVTERTVCFRTPVGAIFFRTRSGQPRGPHNLMYNAYRGSFSGLKHPGRGVDYAPQYCAGAKHKYNKNSTPPCTSRLLITQPALHVYSLFLCEFLTGSFQCLLFQFAACFRILEVPQQLLTSPSSSSHHFYPSFYLTFHNAFYNAITTKDRTSRVSLPYYYFMKHISFPIDFTSSFFTQSY